MIDFEVDVLIVGGGLTGALLHIALQPSKINSLLIDRKDLNFNANINPENFDARSLALSSASIRILKNLNIWGNLANNAAEIEQIHVSQQASFGNTLIEKKPNEQLGFVIEMQVLQDSISKLIDKQSTLSNANFIDFDAENKIATIQTKDKQLKVKTKLVVAADGTESLLRKFCKLTCKTKYFEEQALVANIGLARSHHNIAYERFTKTGPLALLPMTGKRCSLVWSLPKDKAKEQLELTEHEFLKDLQQAFGYRLGKFVKVGTRAIFPLKQVIMPKTHANSIVFIGNAAHTLHPVAGQGFNLGLRDVACLAECILKHGLNDNMLEIYQDMRTHDQKYIKLFTENLINIFKNKLPGASNLRGLGLLALDNSQLGQKLLESYARGFGGKTPDLVCGIEIYPEDVQCEK